MAAEHLLDCELEVFAFYGMRNSICSTERMRGFADALKRRGKTCLLSPITFQPMHRGSLRHWPSLIEWLRGVAKPIGIMAVNDAAAEDLAAACRRAQIRVPEEVALIGADNDKLICESAWSPLSSVDCGYARLGYAAAEMLDRLLSGQRLSEAERIVRLPPLQIVRRVSTDILAVDDPRLADAVRFIRQHACDPCGVEDVLRVVPAGRRWLERQFELKLGRTPREEILRVQLGQASHLLLQTGKKLPEIAEHCGFSCASALGRAFTRSFGVSPAAYRRKIRGPVG
ncbi:MAG: substrate-binding domain-containing protein [Phycisphaerae bacterium]|nr:substrate-binding domain-containing protein [Phycisphaerae bacterium]